MSTNPPIVPEVLEPGNPPHPPTNSNFQVRTAKLKPKQRAFLEAYAFYGNLTRAADEAKVNRLTHYDWMETDPQYVAGFEAAEDQYADRIRDAVRQRAVEGVAEPVIWQGKIQRDAGTDETVTTLRRSDRLLEVLAKAKCPEFRDKTELTGPGGGPLKLQVVTGVPLLPEPEPEPGEGG